MLSLDIQERLNEVASEEEISIVCAEVIQETVEPKNY